MPKVFVAIDLGATSGRIIAYKHGLELNEVHRFSNYLIKNQQLLYWDFDLIFEELKKGLSKAFKLYDNIVSIGIDTFGVDFGILDENGKIVNNPLSYRNNLGTHSNTIVWNKIDKKSLYKQTGIQYMPFNTLYQLVYLKDIQKKMLHKVILLPDLIAYYLTNVKKTEITNFSTTNLMDIDKYEMIYDSKRLGIEKSLFPPFIYPGQIYGKLSKEIMKELGITSKVNVVAVCSHDTASAILSIPKRRAQLFISSGTWSLLGTLLPKPNLSKLAINYNFSNELGYDKDIRFLKNIMGLWIVNEALRMFKKDNPNISIYDLYEEMMHVEPFVSYIDVDDLRFTAPQDMVKEIKDYCQETNQKIPYSIGEITMTIFQSLVFKYRKNIEILEETTRRTFNRIYLVGGGTNIDILNQMISSATNKKVIIGHDEATVIGNLIIQLKTERIIGTIEDGINIFKKEEKIFKPNQQEDYEEAYKKYKKIINLNVIK